MSANKFFTIMVVPEKSKRVAKVVVPAYIFKGGILSIAFLGVLAAIMVLDYANVMNQINENKQLKVENRQLKQSVQVFKTKMVTMENSLDRVKTFVTKLRIITNIEDTGPTMPPPTQAPMPTGLPPLGTVPGGATPAPGTGPVVPVSTPADVKSVPQSDEQAHPIKTHGIDQSATEPPEPYEIVRSKRLALLAALMQDSSESFTLTDADTSLFVKTEFEKLDSAYDDINKFALATEQETQDVLERLGEKRALLASTPTRLPTQGYITSGWGPRLNPYDNRYKMHEGLDIANRFGSDVIAPADGSVTFAGVKPGYGKVVILDHHNGYETLYGHNSRLYVALGMRVKRGQRIAAVGNTGHSTGPHCHYEVRTLGQATDPCYYILDAACQVREHHRATPGATPVARPAAVDSE
jgi:murein DD-endopeptidase MepM/ murein hydrolase activator NlpD